MELLPEGFREQTRRRGLMWPTVAPQKVALAHCRWNSIIESLWHGVPMAQWPRYAEQHLNVFVLVADLAPPSPWRWTVGGTTSSTRRSWSTRCGSSWVKACEEGRRARAKAREMMAACKKAVGDSESSSLTLKRLYDEIIGSTNCMEGTKALQSP
jgi:hypothetical protein